MQGKNTDYYSIIGFVLMAGILLWFLNQNKPHSAESDDNSHIHVKTEDTSAYVNIENSNTRYSKDTISYLKDTVIFNENENIKVGISSRGGQISYLEIKEYKTYKKNNLILINRENSHLGITFNIDEKTINTNNLLFSHKVETLDDTCSRVTMSKIFDEFHLIEFIYTLNPNSHIVYFEINSKGINLSNINWDFTSIHTEKSLKNENIHTYLSYFNSEKNKVKDLSPTSKQDDKIANVKWISFKQQFFSTILVSEKNLSNVSMVSSSLIEKDTTHTKNFIVNIPTTENKYNFKLYFVPNKYNILDSYDNSFTELIPLGWGILGWINKYFVLKVFNFLLGMDLNMGIIILILTLLVKVILSPITYKNFVSTVKMKILKPEIEEINEKYKNSDAMKKQQAVMELYNKAGVNPLSGCIPALLQMPILIAMFRFFPASIELRGKSFLWADDLSAYDSIWNFSFNIPFYGNHISLFTLLMAVALLGYTIMTGGNMEQSKQPGMPNMKIIMYFMPVMMVVWFNDYASGLSYYYFLSNTISIFQMIIIRRYVIDEKKIHAKIEENKKKERPKGKLQRKLEELSKQGSTTKKTK